MAFRPSPHHHIECQQSVLSSLESQSGVWSLESGISGPWNVLAGQWPGERWPAANNIVMTWPAQLPGYCQTFSHRIVRSLHFSEPPTLSGFCGIETLTATHCLCSRPCSPLTLHLHLHPSLLSCLSTWYSNPAWRGTTLIPSLWQTLPLSLPAFVSPSCYFWRQLSFFYPTTDRLPADILFTFLLCHHRHFLHPPNQLTGGALICPHWSRQLHNVFCLQFLLNFDDV